MSFNLFYLFDLTFAKMKNFYRGNMSLNEGQGQGHQKIPRPGAFSAYKQKIYGNAV